MKIKELAPLIGKALEARLVGFKYVKSKGMLRRETESGWQTIFVRPQASSVAGMVKLAAFGHVRIEALEVLYTPYIPLLNENPKEMAEHATIVFNCDNVITETSLIHEFFVDEVSLGHFIECYANALRKDVVPLLDKFSNEETLYEALADPDPRNWVTDHMRRFCAMMALLVLRNDKIMFDKIASEFLTFFSQRHNQFQRPIVESIVEGMNKNWKNSGH
jgi:hypothetical protein